MNVLVVDIGGSHIKLLASDRNEPESFDSGKELTPSSMIEQIHSLTANWKYDVVSLGFPGAIGPAGPESEPGNLGNGWVGFDFTTAFGKPVRVVNDAALQALDG